MTASRYTYVSRAGRSILRHVKIGLAFGASAAGVGLPWRARVIYSEALGWVAQFVPPELYQAPEAEGGGDDA